MGFRLFVRAPATPPAGPKPALRSGPLTGLVGVDRQSDENADHQ